MNYSFFTNSRKSWQAMYSALSKAQKAIYMEMYIFETRTEKFDFFTLLKEKAREGVEIKIILDSFGSMKISTSDIRDLQKEGVEILYISHLFHRAHRKILIVDEKIAFTGGVNFHAQSRFWNDIMIRIEGKLVKNILLSFIRSYANAGGKDAYFITRRKQKIKEKIRAWVIDQFPFKKILNFQKIYKNRISKAKTSITLLTPYFMPNRDLAALLHQAVLRGVKVEILIPQITDHSIIDRVNYFYMYRLSQLGIRFYLEPTMNHAKALIIDDKEAVVGSQNIDFLSFDFNSEIGVFFQEKNTVKRLIEIAEVWKKESVLFNYAVHKPQKIDYLISPVIKIFSKIFKIWLPG